MRRPLSRIAGLELFAAVCPLIVGSVSFTTQDNFSGNETFKASFSKNSI